MFDTNSTKLRAGLVINPWAGIGGPVALKGSDGEAIREKALQRGAKQNAEYRAEVALASCIPLKDKIEFFTVAGDMGANLLAKLGFQFASVYSPKNHPTQAEDSIRAIQKMQQYSIDLLIFAGGDGTARDVYDAQQEPFPVIGIPAGTKIHSGVFCITPKAAGELLAQVISGRIVGLTKASVMDINEDLFRQGKLQAKQYGELYTANEPLLIQASKSAAIENQDVELFDLAAGIVEEMQQDHLYIMGSGSTISALMDQLTLDNTLLGIDIVLNRKVIGKDVTAEHLKNIIKAHEDLPKTLFVTVIGGQGHVFGRGNQQLTAEILQRIGKYNIQILATKSKIESLHGRPLIVDSGDEEMDRWLSGRWIITVGYKETILYPMH
jgi:predicted polyphosphate/ATP-dependent NAD kinase